MQYTIRAYYIKNDFNTYATVYIYYEEFIYTSITESPKTIEITLFGSIGGILELFIGASIISIFEIVELLFI